MTFCKRYLDPKADLTFKKVFGEHKDLLISLINALLPFKGDELVENVEYLPPELVPETPLGKNSIVDVRCKDKKGRQFLVEMQMIWTPAFRQRVLFNTSKAFVRQLKRTRHYELLQPVYSLNLVNEIFLPEYPTEFIHHYNIVHELHTDNVIEGLHLTFVELPKFSPHSILEKKMAVLWLKFLTEIDEDTTHVSDDLLNNPKTRKALEEVEESAFTEAQLDTYEDFWDKLGAERLLLVDSSRVSYKEGREKGFADGHAEGRAEGHAEGRAEGRAEGEHEKALQIARKLLEAGMSVDFVAQNTGLSIEEIRKG